MKSVFNLLRDRHAILAMSITFFCHNPVLFQWSQNTVAYYFIWFLKYVFVSALVKEDRVAQYFCPDNWIGFQDKCYYFSEEEEDWNSSRYNCLSQNASLVMIATTKEKVSNIHSLSIALIRDTGSIQISLWSLKHFKHACLYMQNVTEV